MVPWPGSLQKVGWGGKQFFTPFSYGETFGLG